MFNNFFQNRKIKKLKEDFFKKYNKEITDKEIFRAKRYINKHHWSFNGRGLSDKKEANHLDTLKWLLIWDVVTTDDNGFERNTSFENAGSDYGCSVSTLPNYNPSEVNNNSSNYHSSEDSSFNNSYTSSCSNDWGV